MKARLGLGMATAMLALIAVAPGIATATDSGFHIDVVAMSCDAGTINMNIRAVAGGGTTANRLEVGFYWEQLRHGHWREVRFSIGFDAKDFTANGRPHHLTVKGSFPIEPGPKLRLVMSFEAKHNDTALWDATVMSVGCRAPG